MNERYVFTVEITGEHAKDAAEWFQQEVEDAWKRSMKIWHVVTMETTDIRRITKTGR